MKNFIYKCGFCSNHISIRLFLETSSGEKCLHFLLNSLPKKIYVCNQGYNITNSLHLSSPKQLITEQQVSPSCYLSLFFRHLYCLSCSVLSLLPFCSGSWPREVNARRWPRAPEYCTSQLFSSPLITPENKGKKMLRGFSTFVWKFFLTLWKITCLKD